MLVLKKETKIDLLINNNEFLGKFDNELKNHIFKTTSDDREKYKSLKHLYFKGVLTFNDFILKFSYEGHLMIWKGTKFGWSSDLSRYMQGKSTRGKLRPEHSELMKIKMKGIDRGDGFREKKKNQNSSINFKIKFLENKIINFNRNDENEIKKIYCNYISEYRKGCEYKINKIKRFLKSNKYIGNMMFDNFVKKHSGIKLECNNYESIFTEMMSIITSISMSLNENMGKTKFFKSGFVKVKNCLNKTIIKYRSSWEELSISFLEKNNIKYYYEPFYIEKEDGTFYLPDFLLEYNGEKILLEIKGFIRGQSGKKNEELKKRAGLKYCEENGMRFVYLTKILDNLEYLITK